MIKSVEINFPDFGVNISREFTDGINLIEEENGWGKTTLLYTILSTLTKKWGLSNAKMPSGTAKIVFQDGTQMLYSKGLWVGKEDAPNPLIKHIIPGEFFRLSPKEQRETIVKILGIDYDTFMKSNYDSWTPTLVKEYRAKIKEQNGMEHIILGDIERLQTLIINYEKNPVVIQDNSKDILIAYDKWIKEMNAGYEQAIKFNGEIDKVITTLNVDLAEQIRAKARVESNRNDLRSQHRKIQENPNCPTCGSIINPLTLEASIKDISERGHQCNANLKEIENNISFIEKEISDENAKKMKVSSSVTPVYDIELKAKTVGIELKITSEDEKRRANEYDINKRELELKKNQLKSLNEVDYKAEIDKIMEVSKSFTEKLEKDIKDFGLKEVSLFSIRKTNDEMVEDFIMKFDGKEYSELSNGYKNVLHARVAIAFAKKFGLNFILVDEAGTLSKSAFDLIKKEAKGMQIIIARATPFTLK